MSNELTTSPDYQSWLRELKQRFRQAQIKAARAVNSEQIEYYWYLGQEILQKEVAASWGSGFLPQLSADFSQAFPEVSGFSVRNLQAIRQWYKYWSEFENTQQLVAQLASIPWGHNLKIVSKCQSQAEALFYVNQTLAQGWSRNVLVHQIESGLYQREGQAQHNFDRTLPEPQSDLAQQTLKDPYVFDFLSLSEVKYERDLEKALVQHLSQFLLELGAGFAYLGQQVPLPVGEREFFLDLLFYHTRLHCYIVIELKTGDFEPEHAGKLNFYLKAVDEQLRNPGDQPSIGILLCKSKDRIVAEYALSDIHKPMGIAEYRLTHELPEHLRQNLPSIEALEKTLQATEEEDAEP